MDIGTAKPTAAERRRVPHHLIDVADPGERYDVFRYQRDARAVLDGIAARGRAVVVVGGSGLYVRALLDGLDLASVPTDPVLRAKIEADATRDGSEALHRRLQELDPDAAARVDARNVRRVVRYVEAALLTRSHRELAARWGDPREQDRARAPARDADRSHRNAGEGHGRRRRSRRNARAPCART